MSDVEGAGMMDWSVTIGCAVTAVCAAFIMVIMKYSFASQEAEYGEHISTLYGRGSVLKSKAAKAEKKKKDATDTSSSSDEEEAKLAKANQAKNLALEEDNQYGRHHVAIDPDPVILGTTDQPKPPVKPRKRKLSKPILHNKDEVPLVRNEEVETRLEFTANVIPIDEAELLHRRQQQQQLTDDDMHEQAPADVHEEVTEEILVPEKSSNQKASLPQVPPDSPLNNQKPDLSAGTKKPKKKAGENNLEVALAYIKQSELSEADGQRLIEALIGLTGTALWEKKALLVEASQQVQALKAELESERTSIVLTNEQLAETKANLSLAKTNQMAANGQIQEMQRRLQQLHEQHRAEVQGIQQARFQEIQRMQQHSQQLREENQSLRQALPNTDEMVQMRTQLRAVESELKEQQRHVAKAEGKCQELTVRLGSANDGYRQEGMKCAELSKRVEELSFQHSQVDKQRVECQSRAQAAENDLHQLKEHLRGKDLEIKELHKEILAAKQATAETVSTTSMADNNKIHELETALSTLQTSLDNKQSQVHSLQAQLADAKVEVEHASAAIKPQSNGIPEGGNVDHEELLLLEDKLASAESQVELFKTKNDELRKKNWSMAESLDKAETAAASVALLEAEIEEKSAQVHDLKALNQRLNKQNSELQSRIDQPASTSHPDSPSEQLRRELNAVMQQLDEKEETIRGLESSLNQERNKVVATELECKNLLENELVKTVAAIEDQHTATIYSLQSSLDQSEARISDLESILHQSEVMIKQIGQVNRSSAQEVQSSALPVDTRKDDGVEELTVYYRAEIQAPGAHVKGDNGADGNNNNAGTTVKLVPMSGDFDTTRAELRTQLLSTKRELQLSNSQLESALAGLQSNAEKQLSTILKRLNPKFESDDNLTTEQLLESFLDQSLSKSHADNHFRQALVKADSMLDELSETWQDKLKEKDQQISHLKDQLFKLQVAGKEAISVLPWDLIPPPPLERSMSASESAVNNQSDEATRLASSGSLHDFSSTV